MVYLLLTRPRPDAERFVDDLPASVLDLLQVVISPLLRIKQVPLLVDPQDWAAVVFTSSNAVRSVADQSTHRCVAYCVGTRTASLANELGWDAECIGENADQLVAGLLTKRPDGQLVHLRGQHTRGDVALRLSKGGVACDDVVVYDQVAQVFTQEAWDILGGEDSVIAPLFSPRTARHFAEQCETPRIVHFIAMSPSVAEVLQGLDYNALQITEAADAASVREVLCNAAVSLARLERQRPAK